MDHVQNIIVEIEQLKLKQDFEAAISLIEKTIVAHSSDYRLYEEMADIYLYCWKLDKALKAVDFALELNDQSATGNYLKGFILLSMDQVQAAIKFLEASNGLMANNAEVLRNLGWAYTIIGSHQKWIAILKRALNISPDDILIVEDLAMALIGLWEIQSGNTLLEKIGKQPVTQ